MRPPLKLFWGARASFQKLDTPLWKDVEVALKYNQDEGGVVELHEVGDITHQIQLYTGGGFFLLMLGRQTEDGDHDVRTLFSPEIPESPIEILGDYWSAKTVTSDFSLVLQAFKEFFETRDVSTRLMK